MEVAELAAADEDRDPRSALARQLPERHQMPMALRRQRFPAQDIEIAVVRAYFVKGILRAVPLVHYLFDQVLNPLKSKTNRPFFRCSTGIAIYLQIHHLSSSLPWRVPEDKQPDSILVRWPTRPNRNNSPPQVYLPHRSCPERLMQTPVDIYTYMQLHSAELGKRILSSYPALHGVDETPSPLLSRMLRAP